MSTGRNFYVRKIKYLDYYEGQMRIGGAGFVKLEVRDGKLRMDMTVTGLHVTDTFVREVVLCGKGRERTAGRIEISGGKGQFRQQWQDLEDIGGTGISYGELQGIRIPLGAGREVSCRWQDTEVPVIEQPRAASVGGRGSEERRVREVDETLAESRAERRAEEWAVAEPYIAEKSAAEHYIVEENVVERYRIAKDKGGGEQGSGESPDEGLSAEGLFDGRQSAEKPFDEELAERKMTEKEKAAADRWKIEEDTETGTASRESEMRAMEAGKGDMARASGRGKSHYSRESRDRKREEKPSEKQIKPLEDKWPQLWAIYPHIRPFQDQREYLSIGPGDFVLFPADSYKAVNNSFLLHGYYNYKHLILARVEKRGEVFYYIGVPGNFYEREKQVAIMFGFESFECAEEPAQAGDFGYYMMRTEL